MDYAKFLSLWMNRGEYKGKVLLKEKTVIEALQPHGYLNDEPVSGYGWFIEPGEQAGDMPYVFRHSGADGTIAVAWPTNNAMVLWLTHSQGVDHIEAIQNRINMMRIFDAPGPFMVWADNLAEMGIKKVELSPVEKADLTGTYRGSFQWAEGNENLTLNVWEKDDILHFRMGKGGMLVDQQYHLVPIGNNRYLQGRYLDGKLDAVDPYVIIRFIQEDNKITACEIIQGGEIAITAKKEQ